MERLAIIGDVHGCAKSLRALLDLLPPRDQIFLIGDLIDRGPDSRAVVALARERGLSCVMGNHEWLMLTGHHPGLPNHESWLANGGGDTLRNYRSHDEVLELVESVRSFPLFVDIDQPQGPKLLICHAGVRRGLTLKESIDLLHAPGPQQVMMSILWNRGRVHLQDHFVVFGHSPVVKPVLTAHYANIDTGCVYRRQLTALLLPEREFIQVPFQD